MNKKLKAVSIIAGSSIAAIHLFNKIEYSLATAKDSFHCTQNKYYEWRFGKIRYTKKGSGSPLLLVHDLSVGSCGYEFHKLTDQLSKQYEVYTIDMLGYGLSDKPNMTYTSFLYVQLLTDFVKTIIGKKTDVIAVGDSAAFAIITCHNNPEVFNRLILINPQSLYQLNRIPSKRTRALKLIIDTPIIGTFVYNIITSKQAFWNRFQKYCYYDPSKIEEADIAAYTEASHLNDYNSKYSFSSHVGRYMNLNILHALKEINHSIFIIAGREKKDIKSIVENYIYYNNSIEAAYIMKAKQCPHMEAPEKVLNQLDIFLNY